MKSEKISYPGVGTAVGGLLGVAGVFLGWFSFKIITNGVGVSSTLDGNVDWTGAVALVAGLGAFAFGGAYVLMSDPQMRRVSAIAMAICAAFLLVMPIWGLVNVDAAVGTPVVDGTAAFSSSFATGLVVSFVGGVVAFASALLAVRELQGSADADEQAPTEPSEGEVQPAGS